jgi:hypothetical protein
MRFAVVVDGVESAVTCPDNVREGMYLRFRPFDSFHSVPVVLHASSHGLVLNKIPGQTFLQLTGVAKGSEGSKNEVVMALARKKYFLREIGSKLAPNFIEPALEALQTSSYPLELVFGPPGPSEEVSES